MLYNITSEKIEEWLLTLEKVNQNLPPETNYYHRENMGQIIWYLKGVARKIEKTQQ